MNKLIDAYDFADFFMSYAITPEQEKIAGEVKEAVENFPPAMAIETDWIRKKAKAATGPKAFYYNLLVAEWEKEREERTD